MVTMSTATVTFSYLSEPRGADADAASQAPISSFPLAVQETLAVNDLLSILIGIDAKYIHIKVLRNLPHRSSIPSPVPILLHSFQPTLQLQTPNPKPQTPNPKPNPHLPPFSQCSSDRLSVTATADRSMDLSLADLIDRILPLATYYVRVVRQNPKPQTLDPRP
jgi:hypothetical protein